MACLDSCSADMTWYMSKPTKLMNLYTMYGANAAMNINTIPAIGSAIEERSRSIGALTWLMATKNTTTITSFEKIRARTNDAHFPNHPFVASQEAPERAIGAITTPTRMRAFRIRSENQTIAAAQIARKLRKIVMIGDCRTFR